MVACGSPDKTEWSFFFTFDESGVQIYHSLILHPILFIFEMY